MSDKILELRQHERFLVEDTLISVTLRPFGYNKDVWGIVTNTSMNGFQISVPLEILPETMVSITVTRKLDDELTEVEHLVGRVRWCKADELLDETYNLGIEIQDLKDLQAETDALS